MSTSLASRLRAAAASAYFPALHPFPATREDLARAARLLAPLVNTNPQSAAEFRALVEASGFRLPLRPGDDPEIILDARGKCVVEIDPDRNADDARVALLRRALLIAVNTCAAVPMHRASGNGEATP